MHLTHTLPIYFNKDSETLILGSFPSVKSREVMFYYGHPQNRFFKVLAQIYNEQLPETIEDRKAFLKRHKIALYDVIEECDILGSADSTITNVTPIDIKKILNEYPTITKIAINGGKAKELFDRYLLSKVSDVKIIYLPSTSPANARMSLLDLVDEYSKLLK